MPEKKLHFRWDIQGLRAISVLLVVIFHINPTLLSGGYLGVDIFFVISGYLILGFIWTQLNNHTFSLKQFYIKRIYRLAPALFIMLFVTSILGYFVLLPNEGLEYRHSLLSTLFYFSNFYFYSQADYFNTAMEFAPLLHTWSLSVEEQFYMLFPLILLLIYSIKKDAILYVLLFLAIISLVFSELCIYYDENTFAFFASPTRFFQFIIGGLVSIAIQTNRLSTKLNDLLSLLGLIIIAVSVTFYTSHTAFPGVNALLISLGTVLILYATHKGKYSNRFLSNVHFKWIGNASYSIYLWHWPLIVYYKLKISPTLSIYEQIILFLLSILLGYLSWKYIEETMRKGYLTHFNPFYVHLFLTVLLSTLVYTVFSLFHSKSTAYKEKVEQYLDYNASREFRSDICFLTSGAKSIDAYKEDVCIVKEKEKKNYLLLGDSHAAHYYSAMLSLLKEDETLSQITAAGCLPILSSDWGSSKRCIIFQQWALNTLIPKQHFDVIILSMANLQHTDNSSIKKTIDYLLQYSDKVVFLGRTMRYKQSVPRLLLNLNKGEETTMIHKKAGDYDYTLNLDTLMRKALMTDKIDYISTLQLMCTEEKSCRTLTPKGIPMYFDKDHLSKEGAVYILKQIEDRLFNRI